MQQQSEAEKSDEDRPEGRIDVRLDERPQGPVAVVTIRNEAKLNTLSGALMERLAAELAVLAQNDRLRALVLTGGGDKAFIGGADIRDMAALTDGHAARAFISKVHACCQALRALPVPTIARIQGLTLGAGMEIAAACDLRIAVKAARFGMPEVKLGIPSVVEAALLPMLVGWGRTRHMLLLGGSFSAQEALDWGFVESLAEAQDLDAGVEAWLAEILTSKPRAMRLQKQLINAWEELPLRAAVQAGIDCFAAAYDTAEPRDAMRDFLAAQAERKAARQAGRKG